MKKGWLAVLAIIGLFFVAWPVNFHAHFDLDTAMWETVVLTGDGGGAAGVVIGPHMILTAKHVTDIPGQLTVETFDGRKMSATATWTYSDGDFSLVNVKEDLRLPIAHLSCQPMYVGEHVTIVGHPYLEIMWNVTSGWVSTLKPIRANTGLPQQGILVGLDATAGPGNSGGPIFNDSGAVVGLIDAGRGPTFTFAIPVSELCKTLPRL